MRAVKDSSVFLPGSEETKQKEVLAIASRTKIPAPLSFSRVDQRPDLPHGVIGGHKLFQINVVEHRRVRTDVPIMGAPP